MRKVLAFLVGGLLGVLVVTTVHAVYKHTATRQVHKLDLKFGSLPSHPEFYPVVHLATNDGRPFCTAFVIDSHYAATAAHCIVEDQDNALKPTKMKTETFKFLNDMNVDLKTDVKAVGFDEYTDFGLLLRRF